MVLLASAIVKILTVFAGHYFRICSEVVNLCNSFNVNHCVYVCVQTVGGMLENPTEAVNDLGYFDCIDSVMENSKVPLTFILSYCQ